MNLLFTRLASLDRDVTPERCKLHLATPNREGNEPLALYRKGEFDEWQSYQSAEKRPYLFSGSFLNKHGLKWLGSL